MWSRLLLLLITMESLSQQILAMTFDERARKLLEDEKANNRLFTKL